METCTTCHRYFGSEEDFLKDTYHWRLCDSHHLWFHCSCGADIKLSQEKSTWFKPELVMNPKTAALYMRLTQRKELPLIPSSVMEMQSLIARQSNASQLAQAAKQDPALADEILENANNMRLSSTEKISSLPHAISYIGIKVLAELVVIAGLKSFDFRTEHFGKEQFWEQSRICGIVAETIAEKFVPEVDADHAYLAGCLANVGKLVTAICAPETTDKVWRYASARQAPYRRAEKNTATPSHCLFGDMACTLWGLPRYVRMGAVNHHNTPKKKNDLGAVSNFANQVSHLVLEQPHFIEDRLLETSLKLFGVDDSILMQTVTMIKKQALS